MEQTGKLISDKRNWAGLLPYITIGAGLLILQNAWIAIVSYHLGMAIILLFAGRQFPWRKIYQSRSFKILILLAIPGAIGGLLLYILWPSLGIPEDFNLYIQQIGLTNVTWPYFIAYFILINPWLEECFWRGYLGSSEKRIILNDLFFAGYHVLVLAGKISTIWVVSVFLTLFLAAWFWRQANRWNQGLTASIVSHFMADTTIIFAIYFSIVGI